MIPVTSVPSRDPVRHAGEVAERRVALEHVLPLAPDLRDLQEVVHHPQAREAGRLRGARDVGQRGRRRRGVAGPVEARDLQAELERHRILLLAGGRRRGGQERGRDERDGSGGVDAGEPLGREPLGRGLGRLAQLRADDLGRHRRRPRAVARADLGGGRLYQHRVRRHAVALGERAPARRGASRPARSSRSPSSAGAASRLATIRSSTSNASRLARWSRSPRPTTARSRSDETTWSGWNQRAAQSDFPAAVAPTSTTRHGSGSRNTPRVLPQRASARMGSDP